MGGAAGLAFLAMAGFDVVSIAGAILWGVLRMMLFLDYLESVVSIAGAILWGVLRQGQTISRYSEGSVSIAGAILWGVLRQIALRRRLWQ